MHQIAIHLFRFFVRLDGFGLLGLGILDSSFLFMPLGNDLLIIALTARHHSRLFYYAVMASVGSVLGCVLVDLVCRKGGEKGLEHRVPAKRLNYVKRKVGEKGGWALAIASLMPPPFPFTPFIIVASALQYPRKKFFIIIGACRFVRFLAEGLLALFFGRRILSIARSPVFEYAVLVLVVVCIVGSALSILKWAKKSKKAMAAG